MEWMHHAVVSMWVSIPLVNVCSCTREARVWCDCHVNVKLAWVASFLVAPGLARTWWSGHVDVGVGIWRPRRRGKVPIDVSSPNSDLHGWRGIGRR
jgi:hypothetical protein